MPSLSDEIKDIIYQDIPVDCTCPHCEKDRDAADVVIHPTTAKGRDKGAWNIIVTNIIKAVVRKLEEDL